jgi:putative addiction module component (TIGR02574 family)
MRLELLRGGIGRGESLRTDQAAQALAIAAAVVLLCITTKDSGVTMDVLQSGLLSLSAPERLLLAQQLVDSVLSDAMPLTSEQESEVHRRAAAIDAGEVFCEPWDVVRARLLTAT